MSKPKKFLMVLVGVVVVLCSLAAFSAGRRVEKRIIKLGPTATTFSTQTQDIGFFNMGTFDNSVAHVLAHVVAIDLNTGETKVFTRQAGFKILNGVLARTGGSAPLDEDESDDEEDKFSEFEAGDPQTEGWSATAEHDGVTKRIFFRIKGSANTTIQWRAIIEIKLYQP